jgi:hypothetical protein
MIVEKLRRKWRRKPAKAARAEPPITVTTANPPAQVPESLAAAINAAEVTARAEPDGETGHDRVIVRVRGLGEWYFGNLKHTTERIKRHHPDLSETAARRAARLLTAVVAAGQRRRRAPIERRAGRGIGWVWDW